MTLLRETPPLPSDKFVGRVKEREALDKAYRDRASGFIPIYGRRRVGKSELILHFTRHKPVLYFIGKKASPALQIREFLEVASRLLEEPLLASHPGTDWRSVLELVVSRWKSPHKLVLALDEFQWIAEASPELPSVLQELWDRQWKRTGKVLLILCGSYMGFMEREVLGKKSPLYGRRTAQILLRPFPFQEAAQFHARASLPQKASIYFICGGIPLYLRFFSSEESLAQNIARTLFDEFSPLAKEADFLLREELREVEKYYAILTALAGGSLPSQEIARQAGIGDRSLAYYLHTLTELGYLAKRYPLMDPPAPARQVRYTLPDPLLRFWFRFVYPHGSLISRWGPQRSFTELVQPHLESYFGLCFEHLCREALPALYAQEKVTASFQVGEYWDKNVQIDLVGLRRDGMVDLGECKWGTFRRATPVLEELKKKSTHYPNRSKRTISHRLFFRETPPSGAPEDIRFYGLKDLYALPISARGPA